MQFILGHWPLAFVCAAMVVAAVIDGWKLKVPNWLTLPLIVSGWALGLLHNCGLLDGTGDGGMGAGDVKMQMGFGSWVGAFFGLSGSEVQPGALSVIWWAFAVAALIGGAI